jgi:hypothetical protein
VKHIQKFFASAAAGAAAKKKICIRSSIFIFNKINTFIETQCLQEKISFRPEKKITDTGKPAAGICAYYPFENLW